MKPEEPKLRSEAKIINMFVETLDFQGYHDLIETVEEVKISWEGAGSFVRCYLVRWLFNYHDLRVTWYTKSISDDALGGVHSNQIIPNQIWKKLEAKALSFLQTEQVRKSLEEDIVLTPHDDKSKVTATFTGNRWSGYMLIFRETKDGRIQLLESRNMRGAVGERARNGHQRVPKLICQFVYDRVLAYFQGKHLPPPKQDTLDLPLPPLPRDDCDVGPEE